MRVSNQTLAYRGLVIFDWPEAGKPAAGEWPRILGLQGGNVQGLRDQFMRVAPRPNSPYELG